LGALKVKDREFDAVLEELGTERFSPPPALVRRTKARIRGRRLLQVVAALSLLMQMVVLGVVIYALTSPEVHIGAKLFGAAGLIAWAGSIAVVIVGARGHVSWFFRRAEYVFS
jgi:hypothetical protein